MAKIEFFLSSVPFFSELSPSELEKIAPLFMERTYKRGTTIFIENEMGDEFFIVKSGIIKIFRMDDTKEVVLATINEGDYFGEMAVLEDHQVRSATVQAIESSQLYVLKRKDFIALLESNPKLSLKLLGIAMERLRKSNEQIKDLTTLDSRSRIFKMILRLSEEYGLPYPQQHGILIDIKLTHQLLADMTSTVRETVTKALLELQNEKIIEIDKKKIVILSEAKLKEKMGLYHP